MKHCDHCNRQVHPVKRFNIAAFILTTVLFLWCGGVWVYPLYYLTVKHGQCPFCWSYELGGYKNPYKKREAR